MTTVEDKSKPNNHRRDIVVAILMISLAAVAGTQFPRLLAYLGSLGAPSVQDTVQTPPEANRQGDIAPGRGKDESREGREGTDDGASQSSPPAMMPPQAPEVAPTGGGAGSGPARAEKPPMEMPPALPHPPDEPRPKGQQPRR